MTAPGGFVQVWYQGLVKVRTPWSSMPVLLLRDRSGRTLAITLGALEARLLHQDLEGEDKTPRPYRLLLACLEGLGVKLVAVRILNSPPLEFRTHLILCPKVSLEVEVQAPCAEAVICAKLAGAPIYVANELMAAVSADPFESGMELTVSEGLIAVDEDRVEDRERGGRSEEVR